MAKQASGKSKVSKADVHKIVDAKMSMHLNYPAPKGHKGFARLIERNKRNARFMRTGK